MASTLGIDIGGTGIKAALVDTHTGTLASPRVTTPTPRPATPAAVADATATLCAGFDGHATNAAIGIALPAVVTHGIARTAANIDASWIGTDAAGLFTRALGRPVAVLNDADAAGIAEVEFGAAHDVPGVVMVVTLGTGTGSALFLDGRLLPNTELGHLEHDGEDMCNWACAATRTRENLTWETWTARLQTFLSHAEALIWPDLYVVGGAISAESAHFLPLLDIRTPIVPARMGNDSGIIGAALYAARETA